MAPDAPVEQPPYWEKCAEMDFRELRQFIDDSLRDLAGPGPNVGHPGSEEAFLALWEMLRGILDAMNVPVIPPLPTPPLAFPPFAPSEHFQSLRSQRKQLAKALSAALDGSSTTMMTVGNLKSNLKMLDQKVAKLGNREKREYESRKKAHYRPYLDTKAARERKIRQLSAAQIKMMVMRHRRLRITERVRRDIERAFKFGPTVSTKRLPWRVLPPGELSADAVLRHYNTLQRTNPDVKYERDRITKALSLRPDEYYVGMDEFEGYMVLTFARTPKVLMECPVFGNAIYVIKSDWQRLSRMSKRELLVHRSDQVTKIVHKGDWFRRVKLELGIR